MVPFECLLNIYTMWFISLNLKFQTNEHCAIDCIRALGSKTLSFAPMQAPLRGFLTNAPHGVLLLSLEAKV